VLCIKQSRCSYYGERIIAKCGAWIQDRQKLFAAECCSFPEIRTDLRRRACILIWNARDLSITLFDSAFWHSFLVRELAGSVCRIDMWSDMIVMRLEHLLSINRHCSMNSCVLELHLRCVCVCFPDRCRAAPDFLHIMHYALFVALHKPCCR